MRRFIWMLVVLIFSVWLGLQIAKDPGLAFFAYRRWTVEMPLWFAALSLLIVVFLFYSLARIVDRWDISLYRWKNWLKWRRKNKSYSKTNRGFIEILEGHWKNAEYYLKEGVAQSDAPLLNYLALAKSAHEQKAFDRRDFYLRQAHIAAPQADIAIGLTQAQLQLNQGQLEQALATLDHLRGIAPRHAMVLTGLERVYIHLGDWKNLLRLLPSLYKEKIITREQLTQLEVRAYVELLQSTTNRADHFTALQALWQTIPKKLKTNPQLIYHYASQCISRSDQSEEIEGLVYAALKKSWDKNLARLYGSLLTSDPKKQLAHGEHLLKCCGKHAVLLLTLGKLAVRCQLWGKARTYFEESLQLEAERETYLEYGQLLEQLGDPCAAIQKYRNGLLLA